MPARLPSAEERALWRAATLDAKPRRGAARPAAPPEPPEPRPAPPRAAPAPAAPPGPGLDGGSQQRLKRGQMALAARLDLHGMTQAEAHDALARFLARMQAAGKRAVLVVTGKSGVLRQAAPRWLAEPQARAVVLAVEEAQPRHGGPGALYVLLRRKR